MIHHGHERTIGALERAVFAEHHAFRELSGVATVHREGQVGQHLDAKWQHHLVRGGEALAGDDGDQLPRLHAHAIDLLGLGGDLTGLAGGGFCGLGFILTLER